MYDTSVKGAIQYESRYKQLIDFSGLVRHRGISPTDIDGFIDYGGNAFIYMDAKLYGKELSVGQRIAYQNLVKSHGIAKKPTCAIIWRHNVPQDQHIMAHEKYVDEFYCNMSIKLGEENINHKYNTWNKLKENSWTLLDFLNEMESIWTSLGYDL